ncbi:MAG TPA: hypothetical protein VF116_22665 [Ktedonobacterales bacterium]
MRPDAPTAAKTAVQPTSNILAGCALVRLGDARTVERLQRLGACIVAQGDHLDALVIADDESDASDREGMLDGAGGWVLLRWRRREVLVVLVAAGEEGRR